MPPRSLALAALLAHAHTPYSTPQPRPGSAVQAQPPAEEPEPSSSARSNEPRPFASLDYFLPNQLGNQLKASDDFTRIGAAVQTNTVSANAAFGGRLGFLYPVRRLGFAGLSFGYLDGPDAYDSASGTRTSAYSFTENVNLQYLRLMAEARERMPIGKGWALGLGEALGAAYFTDNSTCHAMGDIDCSATASNPSGYGLTWEVEPMLIHGGWGIALRYAQFPGGISPSGDFTRQWGAWGSYLEVLF